MFCWGALSIALARILASRIYSGQEEGARVPGVPGSQGITSDRYSACSTIAESTPSSEKEVSQGAPLAIVLTVSFRKPLGWPRFVMY